MTLAAASLSGLTPMHPQWDLPLPGFEKVPTPYWYGAKAAGYGDIDADEFGLLIAKKLEEKILELGRRPRRLVFGRAGAGRGRRDLSARDLLARGAAHLRANTTCCCISTRSSPASAAPGEWFGAQTYASRRTS